MLEQGEFRGRDAINRVFTPKGDIMRHNFKISGVQMHGRASLLALIILLMLSSCGTSPDIIETDITELPDGTQTTRDLSDTQKKLVEGASEIIGREKLFIRGRSFGMDCSGIVLSLYWYAGIDLTKAYNDYSGNGVTRIYRYLEDKDLLYRTLEPAPGDIIFWDNTYDKNEDGEPNDLLTHVGMVVDLDTNGNIDYIHHNYRKGIVLARMNLNNPDTYAETVNGEQIIVNSAMRMKGSPGFDKWLSSQLYRQFGMGYLLE